MSTDDHAVINPIITSEVFTFKPIKAIHQQLCAFHVYAHDHSRQIESHHYCACIDPKTGLHQCVIFDSDSPGARLIGIEYIVPENIFISLPDEEKKYWHSHKYEIESGLLQHRFNEGVPESTRRNIEDPVMKVLHKSYGKTVHTWAIDIHPNIPLGPPSLMMSFTADKQILPELLKKRDAMFGMNTEKVREIREKAFDLSYTKAAGADGWEESGKGIIFEPREVDVKRSLA